ncbi:TIGR03899 family protein [Vibrio sp. MACH09]|uniref:TIGR03899 family protein n=1 Tax=unclassified Vibrio TaxID=2614977 RepID=UPI0014932DBE|nr:MULTISPECIES: TIGR03899 family protein [unclassified Vibrio]NOI67667.1 TIGR03899 family protein [Vibrio sp. 99-8-1]GLO62073.1 TIGR03899 family protein [Vibrio sp. MACH09]
MAGKREAVTIDQNSAYSQKSYSGNKSHYIKDSGSRVTNIATTYGLDAMLHSTTPKSSLLERSLSRDKQRREQRQKNLEKIIKFAYGFCKDETAGDPDQDWLYRFFDMAQDIHNSSMQRLWAQVLKLEVTNPGATSMKALQVLKDMTPKEAQYLQKAASLSCSFGSDNSKKLLYGYKTQAGIFSLNRRDKESSVNLGSHKLPYSSLLVLFELGLVLNTELESGEIEFDPALVIDYQGDIFSLQPMSKGSRLLYYRFSPVGNELCKLLGNKPNIGYHDQLVSLLSQKFTVQTSVKGSIDQVV